MIGPFEHPWLSGLLGDAAMAEIWSADRQLAHMCAFEVALTRAMGAVGQIDTAQAARIAERLATFEPDMDGLRIGTGRDGVVVPALVGQLRDCVGQDREGVHRGATSQDVIDTALVLTLRDCNDLLSTRLRAFLAGCETLLERFGSNTLMGRTRMQAALPITVADRLRIWVQPMRRHAERLQRVQQEIACLQLGGPVGDRKSLGSQAEPLAAHMAKELGLLLPDGAWHATRDGLVDYAGVLALITGSLGKMGQDLCLMAQQGIDEISISGSGGSSAMAHKENPVLPELLVTLARFNATQVSGMQQSVVHEQERSGAAWTLEWMILPQMASATGRSLKAATELCQNITRMGA